MLKSPIAKFGGAGFAAVVGVILVVSSAGAHQTHASSQGGMKVFTGVSSSTGTEIEEDAAADAAAAAAEAQQEAAQEAAEQAAEAAEQAAEAAHTDTDTDTDTDTETEAADTESNDSGD